MFTSILKRLRCYRLRVLELGYRDLKRLNVLYRQSLLACMENLIGVCLIIWERRTRTDTIRLPMNFQAWGLVFLSSIRIRLR